MDKIFNRIKFVMLGCIFFGVYQFGQAQSPATINYQGVVRDANGTPITNTVVNLQFKIVTTVNPNFYIENQTAVPVNSLGLFSTKIGVNTPLPNTGWQNTPVTLEVFADVAGSGLQSMGTQVLASVPYAFYAHQAGNAMPTGTVNGQTIRWNQANSQWETSSNLTNDNQRVGIGIMPNAMNSKLGVTTSNPFDSTVVTAIHYAGFNRAAGVRALVFGNTNSSPNPYASAIFGSQSGSYNTGNGFAVGALGYGSSSGGFGIGASGFGSAQTANGTAVGIYGTTDSSNATTKRYAAIFDKGAVFIGDSLLLNPATNPGNLGYVLTLTGSNGRAKWMPAGGGGGTSPWIQKSGYIHLNNNNDFLGIGTGTLMPSARVDINNTSASHAVMINDNGSSHGLVINKTAPFGNGLNVYSTTGNTLAAVEVFHSGSGNGIYTYAAGGHALFAMNNNNNPSGYFNNTGSGASLIAEKTNAGSVALFNTTHTTSTSDAVVASTSGFGYAINAISNNTVTSSYAGSFNGGLIVKGKSNSYSDFALIGRDGASTQIFSLRNNGFLTLGQGVFSASKLTIEGSDNSTNFYANGGSPSTNAMIMNLDQTNNNFSSLSFARSGTETAKIVAVNVSHSPTRGDLVFMTRDPANINEVLRITSAGHLKASGTNTNTACSVSTSFGLSLTASKGSGSNDIRGEVIAIITPSAVIPSGASITIVVPFDKPYTVPHVLIQPLDQQTASLSHFIASVNNNSFTVQLFNNTQFGISTTGLKFKYFVVE